VVLWPCTPYIGVGNKLMTNNNIKLLVVCCRGNSCWWDGDYSVQARRQRRWLRLRWKVEVVFVLAAVVVVVVQRYNCIFHVYYIILLRRYCTQVLSSWQCTINGHFRTGNILLKSYWSHKNRRYYIRKYAHYN